MPRQRKAPGTCLNLASLIQRARHHPYHLRRSTMRRGLQASLWSANLEANSLAATLSTGRHMRQQQLQASVHHMSQPHHYQAQQRHRMPRVRRPSVIAGTSGDHLRLTDAEIAESIKRSKSQEPMLRDNPSTIVLHRNPHFNALNVKRSGIFKGQQSIKTNVSPLIAACSTAATHSMSVPPLCGLNTMQVKLEPQERRPPMRKKIKPKKITNTSSDSGTSAMGTSGGSGGGVRTRGRGGKGGTQSTSTSAVSSGNSKSCSEESHSYDECVDEEAVVNTLAMVPAHKIEKKRIAEPKRRGVKRRRSSTRPELFQPQRPSSSVPHASALGCPTLSAILLSVDNFLKRRRLSSHLR